MTAIFDNENMFFGVPAPHVINKHRPSVAIHIFEFLF